MMSIKQLRFRFPRAVQAIEARQALLRKAASFGLVGVLNTVIDFSLFSIGYFILGLPLLVANTSSWLVAVSCSYVMNSMFTFAAESGRKLGWRRYAAFVASGVIGLIANNATLLVAASFAPMVIGHEDLQIAAAKVCAIGASFVVNFSLSHFVVFRRRVETAEEA